MNQTVQNDARVHVQSDSLLNCGPGGGVVARRSTGGRCAARPRGAPSACARAGASLRCIATGMRERVSDCVRCRDTGTPPDAS